ncbi:MAG: DUF3291 domain-containing protein [Synechococcales cyanobacterium C42_A2020_086]|nr:DUF3291 domain-containing protein [Synechococcales cyanobacterium C42_A2020_086]
MILVAATRLRLRSPRYLLPFLRYAFTSFWQAHRAPGNLGVRVHRQPQLVFWTLSLWQDEASLMAYRNSGSHRRAMPKLVDWCDEAITAHWPQEHPTFPTWGELEQRLATSGRPSRVRHPSAAQAALLNPIKPHANQ